MPSWIRLDVDYFRNQKVAGLGKDAKLLDIAGMALAKEQGTDGLLSAAMLRIAAAGAGVRSVAARELVAAGRWVQADEAGSYQIHDYVEKQGPASSDKAARASVNDRVKAHRERKRNGGGNGVTPPAGNGAGNAGRNGVGNASGNADVTPRTSTSTDLSQSVLNHQGSRAHDGNPEMERSQGSTPKPQLIDPANPVAARWLAMWPPNRLGEACDVLDRCLRWVDVTLVDEAIGHVVGMGKPPGSPRYLATLVLDWAGQRTSSLSEEAVAELSRKAGS